AAGGTIRGGITQFIAGEVLEVPVIVLRMEDERSDVDRTGDAPDAAVVMGIEALIGLGPAGRGIVRRNELERTFADVGNGVGETKELLAGGRVVFDSDVRWRQCSEVGVMDRAGGIGPR